MVKVCVTTVIIDFEIGTGIQYISNCLVILIFVLECLCSMIPDKRSSKLIPIDFWLFLSS